MRTTRHFTSDWLSSFASRIRPPVLRSLCLPLLEISFLQYNNHNKCYHIVTILCGNLNSLVPFSGPDGMKLIAELLMAEASVGLAY